MCYQDISTGTCTPLPMWVTDFKMSKSNKNKNKMEGDSWKMNNRLCNNRLCTFAWTAFECQYFGFCYLRILRNAKAVTAVMRFVAHWVSCAMSHHDTMNGTWEFKITQLRGTNMKYVIWWRKENIFTNRCAWFPLSWTSKYIRKQQLHLEQPYID